MTIFTMKRFWIALSLPALIAVFEGRSGLILAGVVWFPVSALLLIWAFFTCRHEKKESQLVKANCQKNSIITPNFELFGKIYTLVETFSGIVVNSNNDQIWVKTDEGSEMQFSGHSVPFRKSHHIRKYELHQYSEDGSCSVYKDALIVNASTNEHETNLPTRIIFIPAFLTLLFPTSSIVSPYKAMPVSTLFSVIFTLLCSATLISFFTLPWGFKDGYVWGDHKYVWFTYLLSRVGSFVCIQWMKRRNERFDEEIRDLIDSVKR
ncbi:hypothetical protein [Trabulsiella odontotermitis]|uniref:hypothetical protein n=1 Tax=Trabulsiella odontotermitis TaxID=379893 RepID=UPI000AD1E008|nr:hypothetical protein [Trabulsiella odontotermitis]